MATGTVCPSFIHEPPEAYEEQRGNFLTSHALGEFRTCPLIYYQKRAGMLGQEETQAFAVGRAVHCLTLEGRTKYLESFAVGGPINPTTGRPFGSTTKAFAEWAAQQAKDVLTADQALLVESMAAAVHAHPLAAMMLAEGEAEGVLRTTYADVACQIRIDWWSPAFGILDLKTCDDLDWFESDARKYSYTHQLAFYRSVFQAATSTKTPAHLIAVEKREPYRVGVWHIADESLDVAEQENAEAIGRLRDCEATDRWPSGYESLRILV